MGKYIQYIYIISVILYLANPRECYDKITFFLFFLKQYSMKIH